jgi:putative transcriptional regulator
MSQSLRGHFLIAVPKLRDSNFFKTVVLMVEHGADGAMGLVINRPSSISVASALQGHFEIPDDGELVYTGGPVEPVALFLLHDAPFLDPDERPVIEGLFMGSSAEAFERVLQAHADGNQEVHLRVFSGCAGWGPGQLEEELGRGDWLTCPACEEMIYAEDPYDVWDRVYQTSLAAHRLLSLDCPNPELN